MNYFELYPGDYLRDTSRLSLHEHGAYLRLLMAYYAEEQPLPAAEGELFVIVSAVSTADKAAVRKVADRFFPIDEADGLRHNNRADEEIAKAQKRIETSRANGGRGGRPKKPEKNPSGNPTGFESRGFQEPKQNPSETCSGEALHTPHANLKNLSSGQAPNTPDGKFTPSGLATPAGLACRLMREAGCPHTNPSHPELLAALAEGVLPQTLADTTAEALSLNPPIRKPFAWAIATARGRHAEGARQPPGETHAQPRDRGPGRKLSVVESIERNIEKLAERNRRDNDPPALDGTAVRVDAG